MVSVVPENWEALPHTCELKVEVIMLEKGTGLISLHTEQHYSNSNTTVTLINSILLLQFQVIKKFINMDLKCI
jgi:hypothetical protein